VGQRAGELGLLELRVDRGRREQVELQRLERRVAVLLEALGVRLRLLLREADQVAGDGEQARVERQPALEEVQRLADLPRHRLRRGDRAPGPAVRLARPGRGRDALAQGVLRAGLAAHQLAVGEALVAAFARLPRVLDAEEVLLRVPRLFHALFGVI